MGNHEFCEDCHENNFHRGRECDPVKKAKVDAEKQVHAAEKERGLVLLENLKAELEGRGIDVMYIEYGQTYDKLTICGFDLARAEKECLDCKVLVHESPEGLRDEDGSLHICKIDRRRKSSAIRPASER
jgi:hypothetical protein